MARVTPDFDGWLYVPSCFRHSAQIHEARTLRHQADEEAETLIPRVTTSLLDDAGWRTSHLGEILAEKPRNGLGPQQEVDSGGRTMLRINPVSSSPTRHVDVTAAKQVHVADETAQQFVIRNDDVFIVRYHGDINRVAKPAMDKEANESRVVYPVKLLRLRPDTTKLTPDYLVFALSSRSVRTQIEELGRTRAGNIGVSGGDAQSFVVPVPPLPEQRRIGGTHRIGVCSRCPGSLSSDRGEDEATRNFERASGERRNRSRISLGEI